jgi:23S rRNA (uracil1939-C5)-methyltransferase
MSPRKHHTILIEKLVAGGLGLGRLADGMVVLVPYVLPGEKVVVREMNRRKGFISGSLVDIATPSRDRIAPPCPLYGRCGGCDLQHAAYGTQLDLKKEILVESLQRVAGKNFSDNAGEIRPTIASPAEFGYRQRIRLQVNPGGQYGFFQTGSHVLVSVPECLLADKTINGVLRQFHGNEAFSELVPNCTSCELLFDPDRKDIITLLHVKRKSRPRDTLLATELLNSTAGLASIFMMVEGYGLYNPVKRSYTPHPPYLSQTLSLEQLKKNLVLSWEAGAFCQVNLGQNVNLISFVLTMLSELPHRRVLDLYCGYGNFSLPIAHIADDVIGIENQNAAVRSGKRNMQLNGITNCSFIKGPVEAEINTLIKAGETFDTVILDPPREGAAAVVPKIHGLGADHIIYISCNPATLARDLVLLHSSGYAISQLVPVDMFPQTHHMESVTLLKRTAPVSE